jgi:hypothetical protein
MLMWGMNVRRKKAIGCANPKGVKRSGFGRSETIATEKLERRLSVGAVVQI